MARKQIEVVIESLTGKEVKDLSTMEQVFLAVDDEGWELDLAEVSKAKLLEAIAPFIQHEDPVSPVMHYRKQALPPAKPKGPSITGEDRQRFIAWALEAKGEVVAARGRVKADLLREWEAAGRP